MGVHLCTLQFEHMIGVHLCTEQFKQVIWSAFMNSKVLTSERELYTFMYSTLVQCRI